MSPPEKKRKVEKLFPLGNPSTSCGVEAFDWLISPYSSKDFFEQYWDTSSFHVSRSDNRDYYEALVPLESALKKVPSSADPESFSIEKAEAKFSFLHALVERLENFTGMIWKARYTYSKPEVSEWTKPVADDHDNFVIQISGSSSFRLTEPDEPLLVQNDPLLIEGESLQFDDEIKPGDLLYFPRGHGYQFLPSPNSAFVFLTTAEKETFADLLSIALPQTLARMVETEHAFRRSMPINWRGKFGRFIGTRSELDEDGDPTEADKEETKDEIVATVKDLVMAIAESIDLSDLADQLATEFIAARTPPAPRKTAGKQFGPNPRTNAVTARWRNPGWVRVAEAETEGSFATLIFSSVDNKISHHGETLEEEAPLTLEIDGVEKRAAFAELTATWPEFVGAAGLGPETTFALWDAGIIETKEV